MGWCSSKPEHRLWLPLDSVPIFKILCIPFRDGSGPFLFPPSKIHPGSCPPEHSRLLSPFVLFASSPSIDAYSAAPLQCIVPPIVRPPSSVRLRATNPPAPADQCPLLVSRPSVPYAGLHPPPPDLCGWWYLAWVWVGGAKETIARALKIGIDL